MGVPPGMGEASEEADAAIRQEGCGSNQGADVGNGAHGADQTHPRVEVEDRRHSSWKH